ncbi:unnamed protein product, partial [Closterium sp. NIES-54]
GAGVFGSGDGGAGASGAGVGGTGAGSTRAVAPCTGGAGGTVRPRPYFVPLLQQHSGGLTERREPASRPVLHVCTTRRAPRSRYDYTRYTTVFPLRSKGQVVDVLIPWICAVRLQLRERFHQDLPVLRLHSDRGGEFSSDLLREFCHGEGILLSFTLPDSPQQNGIAEHRIGLVMEVARTSMIHAAAPQFL